MKRIRTVTEIAASPDKVWSILSKAASYPKWNPFIRSIRGEMVKGSRLSVKLAPPGGRPMTFRPTVLEASEPHELRWLGRVLFPGLFDGEHRFAIEPIDEYHVRFIQEERFTGALVPVFLNRSMEKRTTSGFEAMNAALKACAEG